MQHASKIDAKPFRQRDNQAVQVDQLFRKSCFADSIVGPRPLPDCRQPMKLVKIPHLGGLPEIIVFYCSRCKQDQGAGTDRRVIGADLAAVSARRGGRRLLRQARPKRGAQPYRQAPGDRHEARQLLVGQG